MTFAPETVNMSVPAAKGKEKAVAPLKVAIPLFKIALSASPMSDIHMSDTISTPTQPTAGPPHLTVPKKGLRGIVYPERKINAVKLQIVQGEGAVVFANVLIIQFLKALVPKYSKKRNLAGDGSPDDLEMVNTSFTSLLIKSATAETWPCPGTNVPWTPGSIWATYPYHRHEMDSIGWMPVSFIEKTNTISICADSCIGSSTDKQLPCKPCESLPQSLKFQDFIARATEASKFSNWDYLNSQQLKALLRKLSGMCQKLKTQVRIHILFTFSN
ncbi:hypothetical protein PILCRDRAFT_91040 [Piloderma croceum F 1598]|uniref:Uncharacterized protein n=1 Tax=Piloderma croceum (strain F 1598) TaxID=765440 RepID=A0A0C3FCS6_PILCF|nr:hypothetical protein PILCRDRAFT_91040 [Piloderma croceum F 1598]